MGMPILWVYLYRVFWNWAGILLAVDAVMALLERYLVEIIERKFHWKPHLPASIKLGFAVVVLFIAQGMAYRDAQRELAQAGRDNDGLHAALNALNAKLYSQEQEIKDLRGKPPAVIRERPRSNSSQAEKDGNALRLTIQEKLSDLITQGIALRNGWLKTVGGPEEVQHQSALPIQLWHRAVENYLKTIPRGSIYVVRFQNQVSASGSYPNGISVRLAGTWDILMSDLARLNEFVVDPDLGKP